MDVYIEIDGIRFSWHDKKLKLNERNHDGISIEEAADAYLDPFSVYTSAGEGHTDGRQAKQWAILFVVQVVVEDDDVLFISARRADAEQRSQYETQLY